MSSLKVTVTEIAERFVSVYPQLEDNYSIGEDESLVFSVDGSPDGFDVHIEIMDEKQIVLHAGSIHTHVYQADQEDVSDFVYEQFEHIRSLLSPLCRIVEFKAGKSPYKWVLEYLDDDTWIPGDTMGLLFYNYFGHRSKRIIQNHLIQPKNKENKAQ